MTTTFDASNLKKVSENTDFLYLLALALAWQLWCKTKAEGLG